MPLLPDTYSPPFWAQNGHAHTILPALFRGQPSGIYERELFVLSDHDFLELDYIRQGSKTAVVVLHGLASHSRQGYVKGMARAMAAAGFDVCAVNFRGCGGKPNKSYRSYHSGATDDVQEVIHHLSKKYDKIAVTGFSLGRNVTLKYIAEAPRKLPPQVKVAVAVSVPIDLASCSQKLDTKANRLYLKRFLKRVKQDIRAKMALSEGQLTDEKIAAVKSFTDFDNLYTAPAHGFGDAANYYKVNSSLPMLPDIDRPVLLLTAKDDPFLTPICFPEDLAREHHYFHLLATRYGGHVGFVNKKLNGETYWSESQAVTFLKKHLAEGIA